jgi:hypothetical protein
MNPTLNQYKATAKHHRRMEAAYRAAGQTENSEQARKAAEELESKLVCTCRTMNIPGVGEVINATGCPVHSPAKTEVTI